MLETVDHPMTLAPAQAYAMKARGDQKVLEVIAVYFLFMVLKCMH